MVLFNHLIEQFLLETSFSISNGDISHMSLLDNGCKCLLHIATIRLIDMQDGYSIVYYTNSANQ